MLSTKKKACNKCGLIVRIGKLHFHKPTGEMRCYRCINKYGTNPFYDPEQKTKKFNRMVMTLDEKQSLFTELIKRGLAEEDARARINNRQKYLYWFFNRRRNRYYNNKLPSKEDLNKKFLEGLGYKQTKI